MLARPFVADDYLTQKVRRLLTLFQFLVRV